MKKYKLIILAAIISFISGCTDTFDIKEQDSIDAESTFTNVDDLRAGLFGLYATYGHENLIDLSNFTDDTKIGSSNGGQKVNFHSWQLTSGTGEALALWTNNYTAINVANRLLEAGISITPEPGEQQEYDQILGECNAFVAWCHFNLLAIFSPEYNGSGAGVPFIDFVAVPGDEPARNTFSEVISGIKAQLDLAESRIPGSQNDIKRVNKGFIIGLRAKVALLEGSLSQAISLSQDLIDDYPLANQQQYVDMFNDDDNREVIFKLGRVVGDFPPGNIWHFTGGGGFMEMSNSIYNKLDPSDVRFGILFNETDSNPADNLHLINKYPGELPASQFLNDIKVMRVSEMYLINAEAKALDGNLQGAAQMIKMIRDARFDTNSPAPNYGSRQEAIEDILSERRLELAYEGHRYLDVKRLRGITNVGFERLQADCGANSNVAVPCILQANDRRFTFPIPQEEIDGNSNITQNPGY